MKIQAYLTAGRRDQFEAAGGGCSCTFCAMDGLREPGATTLKNSRAVDAIHELAVV
jgi:hypothetical protein